MTSVPVEITGDPLWRVEARFYEYALGSSREGRGRYYNGRHVLGESVMIHRLKLLTEIARLLLTMVPDQTGSFLQDDNTPYCTEMPSRREDAPGTEEDLRQLLETVPFS